MLRRCRPRVTPSLARRLSTRAAAGRLDLEHFASIVGPANVITDRTSLEQYNTDWMRAHVGRAFTTDPARRVVCGISSGGICAFNVAWQRPGSFGDLYGPLGPHPNRDIYGPANNYP